MKIIITGANGLVGRACQRLAYRKNFNLTIVSSKKPIYSDTFWYKKLSDIDLKETNYDLLIHCAAATPNNVQFNEILKLNRSIDKELCDFLNSHNIKQVVYLSTMAIYGKITKDSIDEFYEKNEPNEYGLSKYLGEQDVKKVCINNASNLALLRLPGVVGRQMPTIFFRRLYESILNKKQVLIKSKESKFNNAVLDEDIFNTSLNLLKLQNEKIITLNHHSMDIITLGNLIHQFSNYIGKDCDYIESDECNPPFLITNKFNEELLIKSKINEMVKYYHLNYK